MRRTRIVAGIAGLVGLAGCGGTAGIEAGDATPTLTASPTAEATQPQPGESATDTSDDPTETGGSDMDEATEPADGGSSDGGSDGAGADGPVAFAKADLARREAASEADIVVVTSESVTWRDGAIGCPEPGMSYTQATVPGSRIVLELDGREYHYHAADGRDPFYCADPQEPAPDGGNAGDR